MRPFELHTMNENSKPKPPYRTKVETQVCSARVTPQLPQLNHSSAHAYSQSSHVFNPSTHALNPSSHVLIPSTHALNPSSHVLNPPPVLNRHVPPPVCNPQRQSSLIDSRAEQTHYHNATRSTPLRRAMPQAMEISPPQQHNINNNKQQLNLPHLGFFPNTHVNDDGVNGNTQTHANSHQHAIALNRARYSSPEREPRHDKSDKTIAKKTSNPKGQPKETSSIPQIETPSPIRKVLKKQTSEFNRDTMLTSAERDRLKV